MRRTRTALGSHGDELIVGALIALGAVDVWLIRDGFVGGAWANSVYIAACAVPLLWRRTAPALVLAAVVTGGLSGMALLYGLTEQAPIEPFLALLVALYSAAAYAPARALAATLAVATPISVGHDVLATAAAANPGDVWPPYLFYAAAVAIGRGVRSRRMLTQALQERTFELELEREEGARLAVLEERARVARELHDVIAHAVSVIVVQAAAERRARPEADAEAVATLERIERTGREALIELRRLLGVLRWPDEDAARAPQPGLTALDALAEQTRAAGLEVAVRVEGDPAPLPPGVDLSAYRIVQEALTNAVKHAHARRAEVVVRYEPRAVALDVRDDGAGNGGVATIPGAGHGLAGMRERVALYGGDLAAGRRADGPGFEVRARLPFGPPPA